MSRWFVVVNQAAGRKATDATVVRESLKAAGVDATIEVPESAESTRSAIQEAARQGQNPGEKTRS